MATQTYFIAKSLDKFYKHLDVLTSYILQNKKQGKELVNSPFDSYPSKNQQLGTYEEPTKSDS